MRVLVTGATGGIGLQTARVLAQMGHSVLIGQTNAFARLVWKLVVTVRGGISVEEGARTSVWLATSPDVAGLSGGVLCIEADHPAWMQLLQWHEQELLRSIVSSFPILKIRAVQFRLSKPGNPVERPTVVMPEPVKAVLEPEEQERLDALLREMEGLIRKNRGKENQV